MDGGASNPDVNDGLAQVVRLDARPVKRGPGRPKKIEPVPDELALEHHATVIEAKTRFMDADEIVRSLRGRTEAKEILHKILVGLAREAASLEFQALELAKRGRDAAQVSSRRVDALRKIADIELKLREMDREILNLSGEPMMKVYTLWVEKVTEVAFAVLPADIREIYMNRLATALKDFESEAESRLR